ncbi:outer dense fiber protein 2 isoform X5 [Channa argus]|uniref:outer dense fiber protein 2 isoform X5 n=1 Tax=Channa argus TaxID=215402 RepID=UPI0035207551
MKNAMKIRPISPPLHVHVSDTTPIHVHVKSQRISPTRGSQGNAKVERGNLHPTAMVKTRVPFTPQRKAFMQDASYKWEGPTHDLVIKPPIHEPEPENSVLQLADLMSEAEEGLHRRISQYERKVDSLLSEVSCLKNEVELQKKEQLSDSQQRAEQEEELAEVTKELEETEWENTLLRQSMEKMLEETTYNAQDCVQQDKYTLLKKLMEALTDVTATAKQVSALRESFSKMCISSGSRFSGSESSLLACHKELLFQKLETFDATNQKLRNLLREHYGPQMESIRLSDQKDTLLKRLADTEAENARLVLRLQEKDREIMQLGKHLDTEKDNAKNIADLSKSLESTRAHLQGQLRSKEAENNRLAVQIKNLERTANQQKAEIDHLREQLTRLKQQAGDERQALKRATQAQKQRAEHSEGTADQLRIQMLDMEKQVTDALSAAETWQGCYFQGTKDKSKLETELSVLKSRIGELTEQLQGMEDKGRMERNSLLDQLHGLSTETTAAKLENQSLKVETQDSQMELFRQKNKLLLEDNRQLQQRVKSFEKKLQEASSQNSDLLAVISKREDLIHTNQLHLEEKTRECSLLSRKLDKALDDACKQISEANERAASKEQSMQSKILELETQLSRTNSDINQLRSSKDEVEQQHQSRLQDVKDRLAQSDCTNRSLQNYVQFLKASYTNVFGDLTFSSSLRAPSPF